jgi:CDP-diacylglycerol--serine O-phosphatidyltransferase
METQDDKDPGHAAEQEGVPQDPASGQRSAGGVKNRLDLLVEEHEEEVSEGGRKVRRQGIYLLPNLFTTAAMFAGFYSIIAAMRGDFESASIAIFFAMVFDGLDGRIARLTNTSSKFGAEYDSLSDMVSFGVAPALVMFSWALGGVGKFGWSATFIYVACAALRLARFNTRIDKADKNYFTGLASPSAAAIVASTVWVCHDEGWVGEALPYELSIIVGFLTALLGFLMITNIPYYSFKGIDFRGRVPFVVMIAVIFVFGLVTVDPPRIFLMAFLAYAASGPVMQVVNWRKGRA